MAAFLRHDAQRLAARIATRRPLVHCLTNPVAMLLSANALVALGAEPSLSANPRDILPLARGADAILINLGMLDAGREAAIEILLDALDHLACPIVLDPVMADRVPFRRDLAIRFFGYPRLIVKGNTAEMASLALPASVTEVVTGAIDQVDGRFEITGGHSLMARFSGSGCLAGAIIAAFAAIEPNLARASAAALTTLREAAAKAGIAAGGPGTFMPLLLDALDPIGHGTTQEEAPCA